MPEVGHGAQVASFPVLVIGDSGGPHVRSRALAMARLGYEIHTVTPRPSGVAALNETVAADPDFGETPFAGPLDTTAVLFRLRRRIRESIGDIVHVHYASSHGAWLFAASGGRRPLVVSVMGGDILFDEQSKPAALARWLTRQVLRRADFVTAKSDYLVDQLVALGVRRDRVEKILWGVDTNVFKPMPGNRAPKTVAADEGPVIFSPRILKRFYRTDVVVSALPLVLARFPKARLIIAEHEADPEYKREIELLARKLKVLDAVAFAGAIPHEGMPEFYNAADVVVGIPPSDGFPQTVLEAMACGRPNVVSRLSRYSEILVNRESALFVEPTAAGVAAGIIEIAQDRDLAARIGRNGIAIAREKADIRRWAARVSNIYQTLRASCSSGPLPLATRAVAVAVLCGLAVRDASRAVRHRRRINTDLREDAQIPLASRPLNGGGAE